MKKSSVFILLVSSLYGASLFAGGLDVTAILLTSTGAAIGEPASLELGVSSSTLAGVKYARDLSMERRDKLIAEAHEGDGVFLQELFYQLSEVPQLKNKLKLGELSEEIVNAENSIKDSNASYSEAVAYVKKNLIKKVRN